MFSRLLRYLGLGGLLGLALVVFALATPLGSWSLAFLLERLGPTYGWHLRIGDSGGSPLGTLSLRDVSAAHRDGLLEIDLARLEVSPRSYAARLVRPRVRLQLAAPDSAAAEKSDTTFAALPVARFPDLSIADGSLLVTRAADSLRVHFAGLEARYQSAGDSTGRLQLGAGAWTARRRGRAWAGEDLAAGLAVGPRRVDLEELRLSGHRDSLEDRKSVV